MPVEQVLNAILKEMWRLDEKSAAGQSLDASELEFYNLHLETIQKYYDENDHYWAEKSVL